MTRWEKIMEIKKSYKTIYGKPIEKLPDSQITAIYLSLSMRKRNKENMMRTSS